MKKFNFLYLLLLLASGLNGKELSLVATSIEIKYHGTLSSNIDSINGLWIQGGGNLPLTLNRSTQEIINIAFSRIEGQKESDLLFGNYVFDAKGWIDQISQDKRFTKIIVAGHSEGSLIGMIACNQPAVNGCILIAGSGRPARDILKEHFS